MAFILADDGFVIRKKASRSVKGEGVGGGGVWAPSLHDGGGDDGTQ